jgi:hypothetical protein
MTRGPRSRVLRRAWAHVGLWLGEKDGSSCACRVFGYFLVFLVSFRGYGVLFHATFCILFDSVCFLESDLCSFSNLASSLSLATVDYIAV